MRQEVNCVILDDEPFAVQLLNDYAKRMTKLNVLYAGSDVNAVIEIIENNKIDLVFVDIQMPQLSGIDVMQLVKKNQNFIVTTAYQQYALDVFQFNVIDYLLKPINYKSFYQSIQKYVQWKDSFVQVNDQSHIYVKSERKLFRILINTITYIESLKDYIRIHTTEEKVIVYDTMKHILKRLPQNSFIQIHRSYIISVNRLKVLEGHRVWMDDNLKLPIGETYRIKVAEFFNQ
jgi:DNA-binding LytR/AlgR family response regulator